MADVLTWLKDYIRTALNKGSEQQIEYAEHKPDEAEQKISTTMTVVERIRLEAEAKVWKQIATELKDQNGVLQKQIHDLLADDLITKAAKYARTRIDSDAIKIRTEQKVLRLPAPKHIPEDDN